MITIRTLAISARLARLAATVLIMAASLAAPVTASATGTGPLTPAMLEHIEKGLRAKYSIATDVKFEIPQPTAGNKRNVPGFDTLVVTLTLAGKSTAIEVLISKDRATLLRLETIDVSGDPTAALDLKGRPFRGAADAPVTIAVFVDYECPFCASLHTRVLPSVLRDYGNKIKVVYLDYPISTHPWAAHAAVAANCLAAEDPEAYWEFVDQVYGNPKKIVEAPNSTLDAVALGAAAHHQASVGTLRTCLARSDSTALQSAMARADTLEISATPTLFVNGTKSTGLPSESDLHALIDRALEQARPAAN